MSDNITVQAGAVQDLLGQMMNHAAGAQDAAEKHQNLQNQITAMTAGLATQGGEESTQRIQNGLNLIQEAVHATRTATSGYVDDTTALDANTKSQMA